jgi:hypothetical protein
MRATQGQHVSIGDPDLSNSDSKATAIRYIGPSGARQFVHGAAQA